ncbi:1-acyl-sn-glycerol-3-phosphate acyltransferase [Bordetella sp. N]|uniref:lysophospholipid acyltransferase family protein n=1 Tax=Bordetella sp. N TaxID=1746199 RepID=UPI000A543E62|nr:lysophospholipid acyltransferase family protein [Bordetella sp. N]
MSMENSIEPLGESLPPRQDWWLLRLFATAFAFTAFGLGGLFLRLVVFPPQRLFCPDLARRQQRARGAIFWMFRLFIRLLVRTGILTYEFRGADRLGRPGQMIVANHPSLLDVVFLLGHVAKANCIVKHSLATNAFTAGPVRNARYITNDESLEMFDHAAQVLRDGETLVVFPEGTRTPRGASPRFHRGACAIAMRGARVITPVVIHMNTRSLTKGEPWYRIPRQRMHYIFEVGADVDPQRWTSQHPLPIAGRLMNEHLHNYFEMELKRDEHAGK